MGMGGCQFRPPRPRYDSPFLCFFIHTYFSVANIKCISQWLPHNGVLDICMIWFIIWLIWFIGDWCCTLCHASTLWWTLLSSFFNSIISYSSYFLLSFLLLITINHQFSCQLPKNYLNTCSFQLYHFVPHHSLKILCSHLGLDLLPEWGN